MNFSGIASPTELVMLNEAVDAYCRKFGVSDGRERNEGASRVMELFRQGLGDSVSLEKGLMDARTYGSYSWRRRPRTGLQVSTPSQSGAIVGETVRPPSWLACDV